jgi:hypothetical protein
MEAVVLSPEEYQRMKESMIASEMKKDADEAVLSKGFSSGSDLVADLMKD